MCDRLSFNARRGPRPFEMRRQGTVLSNGNCWSDGGPLGRNAVPMMHDYRLLLRWSQAILFAVALASPATEGHAAASTDAASSRVRVQIMGVGAEPCDVLGHGDKQRVLYWLDGFWSGLNYVAAASGQKQSSADADAVLKEVERACRRDPSQILASAAWTAFLSLNSK